ncbi:MAG TPA: hydantoinase/oxoprolinase family protein, partial [Candidatus Acidoferrum sp.]|nr:hydantoinase/oxoprolinase family protein [Candidatus Acidoferrum sp.]
MRVAVDIGGTFTDVAVFDDTTGALAVGKTLTTPERLVDGINAGVARAGTDYASASLFLHGSTIAVNTILERTGARTALVTTEGFRDVYEIGRINRPDSYNLFFQKHEPLVERALRFEVAERVLADGEVLAPLDEAAVEALAGTLTALGIEATAILFLHCYKNPAHEARAKAILEARCPDMFVSASHELSQEYREFERCSTVVANAYIGPRVRGYLGEIDAHLRGAGFRGSFMVVQSTGGLYEAEQARSACVRMLESGPAAGVIGTQALCLALGRDNAIAFDMGGTTAKAGVIHHGEALTTGAALLGGYEKALPVQIAMMDIFEVGTGGGSIARVDDGALRVGPQSAGAAPGPACYGLGGSEATVTDANLVLGRLHADRFLGGEMRLDVAAAEAALRANVANPLGLDVTAAADGILRIAVTAMSYAVKGVTTERGLDVGDFALVAYGGAGPLHAADVARELGMRTVIVPDAPGVFSAIGMLFADLRHDFVRTWFVR